MDAKRDANRVPTLIGVSELDLSTPANVAVDPVTGEVLVKEGTTGTYLAPFTTYVSTTVTLTTANTAYLLPSSEQSGRKSLTIVNNSDTNIYIGSSSVTTSTGILLNPNDVLVIKAESGVYAVCGTNSKTVNCLESK